VTAPDSGTGAAALLQLADLAARLGSVDGRENDHHQDVSKALAELGTSVGKLRATVTGQGKIIATLNGIDTKLAELTAAIEPLLPPAPGPQYYPVPAVQWWDENLSDSARASVVTRLRGWVERIYRPHYGHLAAKLGECWEDHPLCLVQIDWLSELWAVLYLRATRTAGVLNSQAEFGTRILPAVGAQLEAETANCTRHRSATAPASGWATSAASGWAARR